MLQPSKRRPVRVLAAAPFHPEKLLLLLALGFMLWPPVLQAVCPNVTPSGCLEIHSINVQQGTSTLLVGPGGTTVLMDAGTNGKGNTQIGPYLQSLGILPTASALSYSLASHLDADHIGGFDDVFVTQGYGVALENWYNGSTKTGSSITDYFNAAAGTNAGAAVPISIGQVIDLGGGASAEVLAVHGDVAGGISTGATDENDLSVALVIRYGRFSAIWAGDLGGGEDDFACTGRTTEQVNLETPLAQALVPGGSTPRLGPEGVDVLYVNHHGSMSSTNSDSMNLLRPEVAIISVGQNSFNHPRTEVVDNVLLAQAPCITAPLVPVLQTEEGDDGSPGTSLSGFAVGDIVIKTDGDATYTVSAPNAPDRPPDERADALLPWTVRVDETIFADGFESGNTSRWSAAVP